MIWNKIGLCIYIFTLIYISNAIVHYAWNQCDMSDLTEMYIVSYIYIWWYIAILVNFEACKILIATFKNEVQKFRSE